MPRSNPLPLLVLALVSTGPGAATAAATTDACVAAGCVPSYVGSGVQACGFMASGYRCGQTFTPAFSGVLREIRVGLWSLDPHTAVVELRPTVGGLPTSVVAAAALLPGAPYPGNIVVADLSSQLVVLEAGVTYALTLRATGADPVEALASFPACPVATSGTRDFVYSDDSGQTWSFYPYDHRAIVYQVCVDAATATPPASWGSIKILYR